MSERNLVIGGGLLVLVALAIFLPLRGDEPAPEEVAEGPDATQQRRELIEKKRAARDERTLELLAPRVVTGLVTREADGRGVPRAVVLLTRKAATQGAASEPGQPPTPLRTVTDDAGEFSLENVPIGRYVISATASGYLPGQRNDVRILGGTQDQRVTLSLVEGGHALRARAAARRGWCSPRSARGAALGGTVGQTSVLTFKAACRRSSRRAARCLAARPPGPG